LPTAFLRRADQLLPSPVHPAESSEKTCLKAAGCHEYQFLSGAYQFSSKFPNQYIELLNFDDQNLTNGKYFLDELTDKVLTMTRVEIPEEEGVDDESRPSPWKRKEFLKFE
jgi:hypothetical protein